MVVQTQLTRASTKSTIPSARPRPHAASTEPVVWGRRVTTRRKGHSSILHGNRDDKAHKLCGRGGDARISGSLQHRHASVMLKQPQDMRSRETKTCRKAKNATALKQELQNHTVNSLKVQRVE